MPGIFEDCDPFLLKDEVIGCLMYADDTVLISKSEAGLQKALNKLHDYCTKWKFTVNRSKTKVMIFQKGGKLASGNFMYGELPLDIVGDYVYLGINFRPSGVFMSACARLQEQARKALFRYHYLRLKLYVMTGR